MNTKRIISGLLIVTLSMLFSCKTGRQDESADLQFLVEEGYKFATRYNSIKQSSNQMKIYDFLLDVKTREQRLRDEIGSEYADAFITAFNDSAHIVNNY